MYSYNYFACMQGTTEFLILWEGYSKDKVSWVPSEDVGLEAIRYNYYSLLLLKYSLHAIAKITAIPLATITLPYGHVETINLTLYVTGFDKSRLGRTHQANSFSTTNRQVHPWANN